MNCSIEDQIRAYIQEIMRNESNVNKFDQFIDKCALYYERPAHSIKEIKDKLNTKLKGDIFEHFAILYLKHCQNFSEVYMLKDTPKDILDFLGLKTNDMGIDIICKDDKDKYYAVQVKYRKPNKYKSKTILSWKQLSTFYALTARSGPFQKHIVFTNADYIRHVGKRSEKDKSICIGTLRNINTSQWMKMAYKDGNSIGVNKVDIKNRKEIIDARLRYFTLNHAFIENESDSSI